MRLAGEHSTVALNQKFHLEGRRLSRATCTVFYEVWLPSH